MFSALWDLFTCAARALFDLGGAVVRLAFHLLSALAGALLWPLKALWTLLFGDWERPHLLDPRLPGGCAWWCWQPWPGCCSTAGGRGESSESGRKRPLPC